MASRVISRLNPKSTVLMVCDMQEKFRPYTKFFPQIVSTSRRLVDTARILGMKTIVTEHYSKGLGHTVHELGIDADSPVFGKTKFSMCIPEVDPHLKGVENVILVGLEAHVCVLHTTYDLLEKGIGVHVAVDAVSSRGLTDRKYAFKQMDKAGAILTTSECAIYGLIGDSAHPMFKEIQKVVWEEAPDVGLVGRH